MHPAPAALAQRQGDILCLSDLHLGPQRPELNELFLRFCREIPAGVSDLCILGDLFDFWVHRAQALEESQNRVLRALQMVQEGGIRVWVMTGNRDFALAPSLLAEFGITALPDPTLLPGGIVLTHGDLLCTQDHRYLRFRRIIRNPLLLGLLRILPYAVLLGIGRRLRRSSQKELQKKTITMMQATDRGIAMAIRGEGIFASPSAPYRILIHGHTHQAIDEDLRALHAHRFVLSDWNATGATLLRCSPTGECSLWRYPPR